MSFPPNTFPPSEPAGSEIVTSSTEPATLREAQAAFRRYERPAAAVWRTWAVHLGLLLVTVFTTTLAGVRLTSAQMMPLEFLPLEIFQWPPALLRAELTRGLWFALPFLGVLTVHEFGHYFVARYHRVRTTLPYYIPFPLGLGTFGAIIRIKDKIFSRREFFDIGIAGPLAGLVVAVLLLGYGFTHLPPLDYLFSFHPDYAPYGADYARYVYGPDTAGGFVLARPLLYQGLEHALADPARLPHPNELLHYPVLVAGLMALFFTALNLLPLGQFDGGHILYGLLGFRRYNRLVPLLFTGFIFYAGLGLFSLRDGWQTWLYGGLPYAGYLALVFWRMLPRPRQGLLLGAAVWAAQLACATAWPTLTGNPGWLLMGLIVGRFIGVYHPQAPDERPLSAGRQVLGWLMVVIFVLCFTPSPFQ
ncbi:site-2 protease family protein [Hymenobacter sp. ASUV-10]|uniref:Site-2 protease family protein n=1 Tax=Hymenobacter aranciens TaxID=3063996 RepID=A0ABT9BGK3_9BACT|nr:site-2 protease family protein [Hymenobacter sp. ASUV-10]MDO7877395.1 site-2 protease family protein [Hymenobacter sp. ASUV-10]